MGEGLEAREGVLECPLPQLTQLLPFREIPWSFGGAGAEAPGRGPGSFRHPGHPCGVPEAGGQGAWVHAQLALPGHHFPCLAEGRTLCCLLGGQGGD